MGIDSDANWTNLVPQRAGHFALESGHHGELWLDLEHLFQRPRRLRPQIDALARRIADFEVAAVCGPVSGGAFLAQAIATALDLDFHYTERFEDRSCGAATVAYRLSPGSRDSVRGARFAVVDDVVNAGSAVRATCAELECSGAVPVALAALLVLGTAIDAFADERGLAIAALARWPNQIWTPGECPHCAAGVPLETVR